MSALLISIIPFAIGAAISPTLLMIEVFALSSRSEPVRKGWMVALGSTTALLAYAAVGVLAGSAIPHHHPHHGIDAGIDLAAGILLAALVVRQIRHRNEKREKPGLLEKLSDAPAKTFFTAGLIMMATNFSTIILFMPAIRIITKAHDSFSSDALAMAVFMVIALLPVLLPVSIVTVLGDRASDDLARLNAFVTRRSLAITATIGVVFALYFLTKGISEVLAA